MNMFLDISDDIGKNLRHEIKHAKRALFEDKTQMYFQELSNLRLKYPDIMTWTKEIARYAPTITSILLNTYRNSDRSYLCLFVFRSLLDAYQYIAAIPMFYKIRLQKICIRTMSTVVEKGDINAVLLGFYYLFRIIEYLARVGKSFRGKVAEIDFALRFIETETPDIAYRSLRDYWYDLLLQYIPPNISTRIGFLLGIIAEQDVIRLMRVGVSNILEMKVLRPSERGNKFFRDMINRFLESPETARNLIDENNHHFLVSISLAMLKVLSAISSCWVDIEPFDLTMVDPSRYASLDKDDVLGRKIYDLCLLVNSFIDKLHKVLDRLDKKIANSIMSLSMDAKKIVANLLEDSAFLTHKDKHIVEVPKIRGDEIIYEERVRGKENVVIRRESINRIDQLKAILEKINNVVTEEKSALKECMKSIVRIFGFFATLDPLIGLKRDDAELIISYFDARNLWMRLGEILDNISEKNLKDIMTD